MDYESEKIEYKVSLQDNIYREVIAFANTDGGIIYLGIDDRGNIVGLDNVDESYTRLTNGIRDAIHPDVTLFVRYYLQDNKVISIEVDEGSDKPYYLTSNGLKPSGVYIRQGASSVQTSPEQIRALIAGSSDNEFETMKCFTEDLTFDAAEKAFQKYQIDFSEDKYPALGLRQLKGDHYTNLALILSDQCPHTTKIAVYDNTEDMTFTDAREFKGSIFTQLEEAYDYLTLCNHTKAVFRGLERIEKSDYPEAALREALLNALIHRSYAYSGSIIINVNDRQMEFISLGGLPPGLTPDDIRSGISQPRNKKLAAIFFRLRLIEACGTGIRRIFHLYRNCPVQPEIIVTEHTFKLVLPNQNTCIPAEPESPAPAPAPISQEPPFKITPQMQTLLDYLDEYNEISDADLQSLLNIKKTRAYILTRTLQEHHLITIHGRGADKVYRKAEKKN